MSVSGRFECGVWKDKTLRGMLMGPPLNCRDVDQHPVDDIHEYVASVCTLLRNVYGQTAAVEATCGDIMQLATPCGDAVKQVVCERAALLFAMHMEPEVSYALAGADGGRGRRFVRRIRDSVLPLTVPHYVQEMYQEPDWFVLMSCVLSEMWGGEQWQWKTEAHRNPAVGHDGDRADGVSARTSTGRIDPDVNQRRHTERDQWPLEKCNEERLAVRPIGCVRGDTK